MRIAIGTKLLRFLENNNNGFAKILLNLDIPPAAKLNYIEAEIEENKLKFSYLQSSRLSDTPFITELRQTAKPITVLKKLLPDADLAKLNSWIDLLKLHFATPEHTIEIARGSDILKIYHESNYYSVGNSSLGQSCMRYDKCQPYIEFYTKNKAVSAAWVSIDGLVAARALIWNATHNRKKVSVLDRIYAKDDVISQLLHLWSKQNCDFTLDHISKLFLNNNDETKSYLDMYVGLDYTDGPFPYLDNFYYLQGHRLYNIFQPKTIGKTLTSTSGGGGTTQAGNGYKPNYVYLLDKHMWESKDNAVLMTNKYVLKSEVTTCICNTVLYKGGSNAYTVDDKSMYLCSNHYADLVINDVKYTYCFEHRAFFSTERCPVCATRPIYCRCCSRITLNFISTPTHGNICALCQVQLSCTTCNVTMSKFLMIVSDTGQYYCAPCRTIWEICVDCSCAVEPGNECEACANDYSPCENCGTRTHYDNVFMINGDDETYWCSSCIAQHTFTCARCSYYITLDESSTIETICNRCYDEYAYVCTICNTNTHWSSRYVNTCENCVDDLEYRCVHCGTRTIIASSLERTCENCVIMPF